MSEWLRASERVNVRCDAANNGRRPVVTYRSLVGRLAMASSSHCSHDASVVIDKTAQCNSCHNDHLPGVLV